jgi:hypothetical protein
VALILDGHDEFEREDEMKKGEESGMSQAIRSVMILLSIGIGTLIFLAIPMFGIAGFAGLGHLIADSGNAKKAYNQSQSHHTHHHQQRLGDD